MAAILPHLAQPDETTPIERAYNECVSSLHGPGLGESAPSCPSPMAVLADSHAGLLGMTFVRQAVEQDLQGRSFVVQAGNAAGKDTSNVYLVLDDREGGGGPGIGPGPAWNPTTSATVRQYKLLSWTSKMNTPSWSIPAGATQIGGACPGAAGGQSVVDDAALKAGQRLVTLTTGKPVNLAQSVCQFCYAIGGQYSTGQVQFAQVLRYLWTRQAIDIPATAPDGSPSTAFVETMVYAIENANYRLDGGKITKDDDGGEAQTLPPEPTGQRFFRIHDSGDFFSAKYLRQWKQICDRLPDIKFWAPSRVWATPWGVDLVNEINAGPSNLVVRPSIFEVNEAPPPSLGPGWAQWTTVLNVKQNEGMTPEREKYVDAIERKHGARAGTDPRYTWDCRAYATDDAKHTCRKAVAPPELKATASGKGCRACWLGPDEIVNYSLH